MIAKCYFCRMIRNFFLFIILSGFSTLTGSAQSFVKTADLFKRSDISSGPGQLTLVQDPSIDTLISRYIHLNSNLSKDYGHYGMEGFRIQIYSSSNRNARDESNKTMAQFLSKFPEINAYQQYADPGYFKIRAGNFRTKTEATRLFQLIRKEFPDAYIVPDFINFPDLNTK